MVNRASNLTRHDIKDIFPQLVERYKFPDRRPIGNPSGFGVVWRLYDKWLNQVVAIKVSADDLTDEITFCRNIDGQTVRVFDYFRGEDTWNAYTMELLQSPWISLANFIKSHKYKKHDLQHYFDCFQIARGVLHSFRQIHGRPYARKGRYVHADIKPDNMFVLLKPKRNPYSVFRLPDESELIKIIDLGITLKKGDLIFAMTPAYAFQGALRANEGYDLYALAITFTELLVGVCPDHDIMLSKTNINKFIQTNNRSSGSDYLDSIAIEFICNCAKAATKKGLSLNQVIEYIIEYIIDVNPIYYLAIKSINKNLTDGLNKTDLVEFLFDSLCGYFGWERRSQVRLDYLKDFVVSMYESGMLVRDGHSYFIRK